MQIPHSAEEGFFKQLRTSMQRAVVTREDPKRKRSASAERVEATGGPASPGGGGDARRRKWTRLLLRELYDLGFHASAESLEREARVQLRSDAMKALERHVRARQWDAALALVAGGSEAPRLAMKSPAAAREAALMLLRRKYIDLLVKRELRAALQTFQEEISAVYELTEDETKQLAMLLLCTDAPQVEQLVAGLPWKETDMLARVEQLVSPEEIIPEGALQRLVSKDLDIEERAAPQQLQGKVIGECTEILMQHTNDVWELAFSPDGRFLASSSRDGSIVIWELSFKNDAPTNELSLQTVRVRRTLRSLEGDVESLAWSPNSESLLCCGSRSNIIQLWSVETEAFDQRYEHPAEGVASVKWLPNGNHFISGSADKMLILWNAVDGTILYQWSGRRVLDVAVHPKDGRVFALMPSNEIYIYDPARRTDELFYEGDHLISCISLSSTGQYLLVNLVRHEEMVCLDVDSDTVVARYRGLQEQRYVIRPCFAGNQDEVVVSGSEDGRVLLWIRENGKLLTSMDGHSSVVNVVQCHPVHRNIVASASDDETIRVWRLTSHHA